MRILLESRYSEQYPNGALVISWCLQFIQQFLSGIPSSIVPGDVGD